MMKKIHMKSMPSVLGMPVSITSRSAVKRASRRPTGTVSKKAVGAEMTDVSSPVCRRRELRSPINIMQTTRKKAKSAASTPSAAKTPS